METRDFNKKKEDYYKGEAEKWNLKESSSRPSSENVRHYNQLVRLVLGKKKNPKIVVLGATPEIREMLYKYHILNHAQIICLEMLPAMYYGMSNLVVHKAPNERFVQGDWLKMPFKKNSIDIFIGDLIVGNIYEEKDQKKFLASVNKCLKKDGAFIERGMSITSKAKIKNLKECLFKFVPEVLSEKINIKAAATAFWTDMLAASWYKNKENKLSALYFKDQLEKLKKYFQKKNLSDRDKTAKMIWDHYQFFGGGERYWTYGNKEHEEHKKRMHFKIQKTLYADDFSSASQFPVYLFRPKMINK